MAKGLTDRQQEVFNFIVTYIEEKGYPPTIREMQEGLSIGSLRGVTIHLDALHKKGYIERLSSKNGPRTSRGIRILARLEGRAKDEEKGVLRLPLIGTIAAGTPLLATQNIEDIVPVPTSLLRGGAAELLPAAGPGREHDGRAHPAGRPGDYPAAGDGGERRHRRGASGRGGDGQDASARHGNRIELQPQNPNYAPIPLRKADNAAIIGKVVGLLRGY